METVVKLLKASCRRQPRSTPDGSTNETNSVERHFKSDGNKLNVNMHEDHIPKEIEEDYLEETFYDSDMELETKLDCAKKRLSVEDIKKMFEKRSNSNTSSPTSTKKISDIPLGIRPVGDNISRFEQQVTSVKDMKTRYGYHSVDRKKKKPLARFGSMVVRSRKLLQGCKEANENKLTQSTINELSNNENNTHTMPNGTLPKILIPKAKIIEKKAEESKQTEVCDKVSNNLPKSASLRRFNGPATAITETKPVQKAQSAAEKSPPKRSFLFSPQAYNSLQRSGENPRPHASPKQGFKMDLEALTRPIKSQAWNRYPEVSTTGRPAKTQLSPPSNNEMKRHSLKETLSENIRIPPRIVRQQSVDSDAYADVWDSKINRKDEKYEKSKENVYADVYDSAKPQSRRSYCTDDDGDYSEVFDAMNTTNKNHRHSSSENKHTRPLSQNTPPSSGQPSPRPRRGLGAVKDSQGSDVRRHSAEAKHRNLHISNSVGFPEIHGRIKPPPPSPRISSKNSSMESLSSDSLMSTDRKSNPGLFSSLIYQKRHSMDIPSDGRSGVDEDPIYCVI